jgi:protein-disulfide isomerase
MRYTVSMETQHEDTTSQEMSRNNKKVNISIPAAIITGAVIIALALILISNPKKDEQQSAPLPEKVTTVSKEAVTIREDDYVRGNKDTAEVVLFEYADSDCYYCQQFHPTVIKLMEEYKGKIAWVYRFFPLGIHPNAYTESLALQCAGELGGNDAFWTYLDTVIDVTLNPTPASNKTLVTFATQQGIDGKLFASCLDNPNTANRIDADTKEAQAIGAAGTPFGVLVNKKGEQIVIAGAYPIESMREMIDTLLK